MGEPARSVGLVSMALLLALAANAAGEVPPGQALPLAVGDGNCDFTLPPAAPDDKYLLILGALTPRVGPHVVNVRTEPSDREADLRLASAEAPRAWLDEIRTQRRRIEAARAGAEPADEPPASPSPPSKRIFYLFVKDQEFTDPAAYVPVTAELAGLGRHCQVYADGDRAALQPTVNDVIRTFDTDVYPRARRGLGRALDVDRDGRFTMLVTARLGRMVNGRVAVSGFVRGSDFDRDMPAPFSNHCDMMYLNADLKPGPHLRTVLAHEYTHAVIFSEHVFGPRPPGVAAADEQGWLNEALAHRVEKERGFGWTNLDYRVSAFLNAPERYGLVIPDYYEAGLWRSHGHRGAAFLFLDQCIIRADAALVPRLVQSPLNGTRNLETATARPFAESFRDWTTALATAGMAASDFPGPLCGTLGERWLCGPRFESIALNGEPHRLALAGTSAAYLQLHGPTTRGMKVRVEAAADVDLQVTLIRLPPHAARLELASETQDDGKLRLTLRAHDADVRLTGAAWERLVPTANDRGDTNAHSAAEAAACCRTWFGPEVLHPGDPRTSPLIDGPAAPGDTWVFKVTGHDATGPVRAWAVTKNPFANGGQP